MRISLAKLLAEVRACQECAAHLPNPPRPIVAIHAAARILIVGQAPGRRVQQSGVAWDDPSGVRLRAWLGVDALSFYDARRFALLPMGLCYPGSGRSGDLPPRSECAPLWHARLRAKLPRVGLTLLLSQYALDHYLGERAKPTLTETVRAWREYAPEFLPLPHPSPRNNRWLVKNPWFESEVVPELRERVAQLLGS